MRLDHALGADGGVSVQCLTLYIPDRDQQGRELGDQRRWVLEAARLLAEIGGGVTIMPPVEGGWVSNSGTVIWEKPILVYTYIDPDSFVNTLPRLREFLHKLGRETNQGEVAFEFDGTFYRIREFDSSGSQGGKDVEE